MFTSGFFNSINSDRRYNAEQMAAIFDGLITDGIFDSIGDHFQVTPAASGLVVNIGTGRAWLNQTWSYNDTLYPVTLDAASPSLGRKDLICIKVDKSNAVRSNSLVVVAGTPAASPVEPTVTDDATNGIYYHKLAAVTVPAGATSISAANITNYIGLSTGTPYVTGVIQSTTVDELWSQWDGEFNDWWDDIKSTLDDNVVTTILNKIDHITPKESTMNLYGFSHIDPPPSGKTYQAYSTDAILQQISSLLNSIPTSSFQSIYYTGTGQCESYQLLDVEAYTYNGSCQAGLAMGVSKIMHFMRKPVALIIAYEAIATYESTVYRYISNVNPTVEHEVTISAPGDFQQYLNKKSNKVSVVARNGTNYCVTNVPSEFLQWPVSISGRNNVNTDYMHGIISIVAQEDGTVIIKAIKGADLSITSDFEAYLKQQIAGAANGTSTSYRVIAFF